MKAVKWLNRHAEEVLLVIMLIAMLLVEVAQIFMRRVMGASLSWAEEIVRYLFVWFGFLSISFTIQNQSALRSCHYLPVLWCNFRFRTYDNGCCWRNDHPAATALGYDLSFCDALVAISGGLGVIIPPSIPFILYSMNSGHRLEHSLSQASCLVSSLAYA